MGMIERPSSNSGVRTISRRGLIGATAATAGLGVLPGALLASVGPHIRAIAFDALAVFDPRSVTALAHANFPEKGDALASLWSSKLFSYTWLSTAAGHYRDFETLADASLRFSAGSLGLVLPHAVRRQLVEAYSRLDLWPDVEPILIRLRAA